MEELSVVLFLQKMLDDALIRDCSDIHLYTAGTQLVVKFRRQGELTTYTRTEQFGADVVRRIKALARMDIADSRVPQDGAFHWESDTAECDVRVSTLPTIHGEAAVMRLFTQYKAPLDFSALGMTAPQARMVRQMLTQPSGLILVVGPTNSGKTTTLYAMVTDIARCGRKVVCIEDPVERSLEDCQQVQVRESVGITFDVGVRAVLRHDPDVLMIGEIRDGATASAAVRAALTGHLVLSTTHAKDPVGAFARLADLGVSRSALAEVTVGVVHQAFPHSSGERQTQRRSPVFHTLRIEGQIAKWLGSEASWWEVREHLENVTAGEGADAGADKEDWGHGDASPSTMDWPGAYGGCAVQRV
ncbi:GspE/PulE family protein [Alicyclobacillus contaminans]|uniref:GspE/PulE family protein n=1 Tax=Alicyclobacillus contaminans TaxID=392016 RepID=UPI000686BAA5|nr:ATPase, T2SS/T4P/T4SS family [Alicyclobacillus contaminans]